MNGLIRILIICHIGLTSQILCQKIEQTAVARGWTISTTAASSNEWTKHLPSADIILLEPQVAHLWNEILPHAQQRGIPLAKVNPVAFATMNGEQVLDQVLFLMDSARKEKNKNKRT